jgi:hypothetical protein
MRLFCDTLMAALEQQLQELELAHIDPLSYAKQALKHSAEALERLQQQVAEHPISDAATVIDFYRNRTPLFMAKVLYYQAVYTLVLSAPPGGTAPLRQHYKAALRSVQQYFIARKEFYCYYRSGDSHLDSFYFTSPPAEVPSYASGAFDFGLGAPLTYSHRVAQIIANDALVAYLEQALAKVKNKECSAIAETDTPSLVWTGSKVALVELIYALHSSGVIHHGSVALAEIATAVASTFGVELGQFHRTFLEIRARKSDRAKFLTFLKDSLLTRMDDADSL